MVRGLAIPASIALLLIGGVGATTADTNPYVRPATARPGTTVTFENGCFGVVDEPPARVRAAFTRIDRDEVPQEGSAEKATARLTGPFTYSIVVPALEQGSYLVHLECAPNDWSTNLAEGAGGSRTLVVLGLPGTDTEGEASARTSSEGWRLVLALFVGLLGIATLRRLTASATSVGQRR
jgi:hypothetical protein